MEIKTNVIRQLNALKIKNEVFDYSLYGFTNGNEIASFLNQEPKCVFKTLVTQGKSKNHYVFMLPVNEELDLKKAAIAVEEKFIELIPSKELLPLTGYIHGGCSPIGMKKKFKTVIHESIENLQFIYFSAGKVGFQVKILIEDFMKAVECEKKDIIIKK